jgi:hypothetical protein
MARNIVQRECNSDAKKILKIMGIEMMKNGELRIIKDPVM